MRTTAFFYLLLTTLSMCRAYIPPYVNFKTLMGPRYDECNAATAGRWVTATYPAPAQSLLALFEHLYEQYHPTRLSANTVPRIPKIMFQIWLGSPLPQKFWHWQESWLAQHRAEDGWTYVLWTDQTTIHRADLLEKYPHYRECNIKILGELYNHRHYHQAPNWGAKSDIVRLEILSRFGGVYLDMDTECLQPLDELHYRYDLYAGIEPLEFLWLSLNNGVIGCIPAHPIIEFYRQAIHQSPPIGASVIATHTTTGPIAFTRAFMAHATIHGTRDIAFPAQMFGPIDRFNHLMRSTDTMILQYYTHSWLTK